AAAAHAPTNGAGGCPSGASTGPVACRRALAARLARRDVGGGVLLAERAEGGDGGEVARPRPHLARFPVVDRLRRRAEEHAAFGGREAEPAPLREQALGAEAGPAARTVGLVGRRRRLRVGLAQAAQLLLERLQSP